jgi:hypothetical protein
MFLLNKNKKLSVKNTVKVLNGAQTDIGTAQPQLVQIVHSGCAQPKEIIQLLTHHFYGELRMEGDLQFGTIDLTEECSVAKKT